MAPGASDEEAKAAAARLNIIAEEGEDTWVGRFEDLLDGGDGQYRVRLQDNLGGSDCAYPGVECRPDGTFVLTTYGHWEPGEAPFILSVRFTVEDLDAAAAAGHAVTGDAPGLP